MIAIKNAGSGLCTRRRLWDAPLNCASSFFLFARSFVFKFSFRMVSNTCERCYSNTGTESRKVRNEDDSLGLAHVSLYCLIKHTLV